MSENLTISALVEEGCAFEGRMSFSGAAKIAGQFTGEIFNVTNSLFLKVGTLRPRSRRGL